jgi:hypothetical protein
MDEQRRVKGKNKKPKVCKLYKTNKALHHWKNGSNGNCMKNA